MDRRIPGIAAHWVHGGHERGEFRCRYLAIIVSVAWYLTGLTAWSASPEILDLPSPVHTAYDLTWNTTATDTWKAPLRLVCCMAKGAGSYELTITPTTARWTWLGKPASTPTTAALPRLSPQTQWTFKYRAGTVALLCNYRIVLTAPASRPTTTVQFTSLPAGVRISEARYRPYSAPRFGDDFMRPEALERLAANTEPWFEDYIWQVGFYRRPNPGEAPTDPAAGGAMTNPWQLTLLPSVPTSTNAFWFAYTGTGPSWVVANPTLVPACWDRYYIQTAVKPEYDSEVGVLAAYQDPEHYLLFRWRSRDGNNSQAALILVDAGEERVLASAAHGFDPGQWYRVRMNLGWQVVEVCIDGVPLLRAPNPGLAEGRVGLYACGAAHPRRPKLDDGTATMYLVTDRETGRTTNDAAEDMRTASCIFFDDVEVGDWSGIEALATTSYPLQRTGAWSTVDGGLQATAPGRMSVQTPTWPRAELSTTLTLPAAGMAAILLNEPSSDNGYAWHISSKEHRLYRSKAGVVQEPALARCPAALAAETPIALRARVDGPAVTLLCNNTPVVSYYDPQFRPQPCGIQAFTAGVRFAAVQILPIADSLGSLVVHQPFQQDSWLITWASEEADWYPALPPVNGVTPRGNAHTVIGPAAPYATNIPGLYWHKGGHYGDIRVIWPAQRELLARTMLHLTSNYRPQDGYALTFQPHGTTTEAVLTRCGTSIGTYPVPLTALSRLVFERRGSTLVLRVQQCDPEDLAEAVISEQVVLIYRDPVPLAAEQLGVTVASPQLPAVAFHVASERLQETFEQAPVSWITQSGVWAVMARYSCQPQWNWFGGFGAGTPTLWSKARLQGDQTVEAYLGVKMAFDNAPEEYLQRYRDLNLTICADGRTLNSGYTVIRGGRKDGRMTTMLLRKGEVVRTSELIDHLLPPGVTGHRQWFAIRMEKRGAEIKVFLDNRLAMTYLDPDPLSGGHAAVWTLDNGVMIGRMNLSAQQMLPGTPQATRPLAVQEPLQPLALPTLFVNGIAVQPATFEEGWDGWCERPGLTGRLIRERVGEQAGANTVLRIVNTYPAGDLSASFAGPIDLVKTPLLHADLCIDASAVINLYARRGTTWYEICLTGPPCQQPGIVMLGASPVPADGRWHHLTLDLSAIFTVQANAQGQAALLIDELVLADWRTSADLRRYGFGQTSGGTSVRLDNWLLVPRLTCPLSVRWDAPKATPFAWWATGIDSTPMGETESITAETTQRIDPTGTGQFFHLRGRAQDGTWGGILHLPVPNDN